MTAYLVFRLYGPMASWGDIAVGEVRPSSTHPSKSAVLGLVAAALRINRENEQSHRELATAYGFAVRVDSMGVPLVDYHTVQVPPSGSGKIRRRYATRREELSTVPRDGLKTILSRRDYRMDAIATVALWNSSETPPYSLAEIRGALEHPGYVLYLGRKACPLALPVEAQVLQSQSVKEALSKANFNDIDGFAIKYLRPSGPPALYWEEGAESGVDAEHTFERRDMPISRHRWQFDVRREHYASLGEG